MGDFVFLAVGFFTGAIGTLVGAGGGFLLAPLFIFLFPEMAPSRLTALSLLAVAANSTSGSIGYAIRRQVHWPSAFLFTLTAVPGVLLGVFLSRRLDRGAFELLFAFFLSAMGLFVFWRSRWGKRRSQHSRVPWNPRSRWLGGGLSFFVGVLSSLLGIGGGIIHVPLLSELLAYPVHLAAGTSHSILALSSLVAVTDHLWHGDLHQLESFMPYLVFGLVIGAQLGAAMSKKLPGHWILRVLGLALFSVAFRLFWRRLM